MSTEPSEPQAKEASQSLGGVGHGPTPNAGTPSSDAHLRRDHGTPTSSDPYIDWGPDLPGRYDGGRARLLVANPRALFVTWESGSQPERWRLDVVVDGGLSRTVELAGHAGDAWLSVAPRTRGEVRLVRDGVHVATLPFETPSEGPSEDTSERWGRTDPQGQMHAAANVGGTALGPEPLVPGEASAPSSSSTARGI